MSSFLFFERKNAVTMWFEMAVYVQPVLLPQVKTFQLKGLRRVLALLKSQPTSLFS